MRTSVSNIILFRSTTKPTATFTVTAATDLITSNAHGLVDGDMVMFTTVTTLPAGLSLTAVYYVINATTNTFQVSTTMGGTAVDITDTGTGAHTFWFKAKTLYAADFNNLVVSLHTSGSANFTLKCQGSIQDDVNFNAAKSPTNRWNFVEIISLEDEAKVVGDTGVVATGTDINETYEINANYLKYVTFQVTAHSAGVIALAISGSED